MIRRRDFIRGSMVSALLAGLGFRNADAFGKDFKAKEDSNTFRDLSTDLPLVAATWPNLKATEAAMQKLLSGGTTLDAVEAGAKVPEADPNDTSVGYGGRPDRDGKVTLDACIMDEKGNAGSVCFLTNIVHAVSVARKVMEKTPHVMLSGDGALQFAVEQGFKQVNLLTEDSKKAWEEWLKTTGYKPVINKDMHDTIGILALDNHGNMSGACTTSGLAYKYHGRVGDSPIIGAGLYVDNEIGGACSTGLGELVMKSLGSFLVVELMRQGMSPQKACEMTIERIMKKYPVDDPETQVGFLAMNKKGEIGAYSIRGKYSISVNNNGNNRVIPSAFAIH